MLDVREEVPEVVAEVEGVEAGAREETEIDEETAGEDTEEDEEEAPPEVVELVVPLEALELPLRHEVIARNYWVKIVLNKLADKIVHEA